MKTRVRNAGPLLLMFTAALAGVILLAILTLPLWLGAALGAIGSAVGLSVAAYSRGGYGRLVLGHGVYTRPRMRGSFKRFVAGSPRAWIWYRLTGKASECRVGECAVTIEAGSKPTPVSPETK